MIRYSPILLLFLILSVVSCNKDKPYTEESYGDYEIVSVYPHDTSFFTQGFEMTGDTVIESTGKYNNSKIIKYDLNTGTIISEKDIPADNFGEGSTVLDSSIFQLTWQAGRCFIYSFKDLSIKDTLLYSGEGWGLTNNGTDLIMSNGSDMLFFRDPDDLNIIRTISVKDSSGYSINKLNELEFTNDMIYANIWGSDIVVVIDPESGIVKRKYDLSELLSYSESQTADVLNGIAWNGSYFFVTGKYWPKIFKIKFK